MVQSLCHETSEIPSTTPTFFQSPSAPSSSTSARCTIASSVSWPIERKSSRAISSLNVGDLRLKPRIRDGYQPSSFRAHHDAPLSRSASAAAASRSADTSAISSSVNTPSKWRNPACARKWPMSSRESSMRNDRCRSSAPPSRAANVTDPGS